MDELLIDKYIKKYKEEIIDNTINLVNIPSLYSEDNNNGIYPYGKNVAKALDFCLDLCKNKGFNITNNGYHFGLAKIDNNKYGKHILIASHVDVVEPNKRSKYAPFDARIINNYIIGRGVIDDKAPLIATIYALNFFKENDIRLNNNFELYFGSNEETGMKDVEIYLDNYEEPDLAISVDDDFPVVNSENSKLILTLSFDKDTNLKSINTIRNTQYAVPASLKIISRQNRINILYNEIEKNNVIIDALEKIKNREIDVFKNLDDLENLMKIISKFQNSEIEENHISATPIDIRDGKDKIYIKFSFKYNYEKNNDIIIKRIVSLLKEHNLKFFIDDIDEGYFVDEDNEVVRLLTGVYNNLFETNYKPYTMVGSTYARKFKFGIGFGAGNPLEKKPFECGFGCAHGPDEAHNIDVLMDAIKVYILGIKSLDEFYITHF